jgi:hypothetical protein
MPESINSRGDMMPSADRITSLAARNDRVSPSKIVVTPRQIPFSTSIFVTSVSGSKVRFARVNAG